MAVRVVVDSSSDLPEDLVDGLGIGVVPLTVCFGNLELPDEVELTADEFWRRAASEPGTPRTAAPPPGRFATAFQRLASEGADGIVCLCLAQELSGTVASARLAADEVDGVVPVVVVDSRSVALGLGLQAVLCARVGARTADVGAVADVARSLGSRTWVWALLEDRAAIRRGGRFDGDLPSCVVRSVLEIHDGSLGEIARFRTRSRALRRLVALATDAGPLALAGVAAASAHPDELVPQLEALAPTVVSRIGPVVGTHTGPGTIGVAVVQTGVSPSG